jgi:RimJ/RimL family protein N-acetyltransferase
LKQIFYGDSDLVKQWMAPRIGSPAPAHHNTICLVEGEKILAGVWLENYNGVSAVLHVAGEGKRWLTRAFAEAVFHYAFNVLGCKKLIGVVSSANTQARRFDEHLGFKIETVIEDADPTGSLIIYSLKRSDCKFLGETHGEALRA